MDTRRLGRSGLRVTPIGFGAFKIGRNQKIKYPAGYDLPDDADADRLLNGVLDLGINYIDTAPAYGLSEERIGRALGGRRGEFVLSTKVGEMFEDGKSTYDFSADAIRDSVEHSLRRLRTDAVDLLLLHAHADDLAILTQTDVVETLRALREAGQTRAIGFSGKTPQAASAALAWADVLMVEYNPRDDSHTALIGEAARRDVGVVVKKGLGAGHLPPAESIRFVLGTPGVGSLVVGSLKLEHLAENLRVAEAVAADRQP